MEFTIGITALFLVAITLLSFQRCTIFEYQRGLLYRRGKFVAVLQPGEHLLFRPTHTVTRIDVRTINMTIPGQEVLSVDNVGLKISLAASYRVSDPYLAVNKVFNYQETLYLLLQLNLREIVGSLAVDDILVKREEIGKQLYEKSKEQAVDIGLELLFVNIKDMMFPGELKNIFAQVVNARKEGLAALERARGESPACPGCSRGTRSSTRCARRRCSSGSCRSWTGSRRATPRGAERPPAMTPVRAPADRWADIHRLPPP